MGKCFDGIRRLDFGDDPKSIDILAMISGALFLNTMRLCRLEYIFASVCGEEQVVRLVCVYNSTKMS